ncbi:hypothetical protein G6F40_017837 [Rhizopus arrhizus]|nr:hypothetical protein G6F40_017837 [Rhizopus arrhizus]
MELDAVAQLERIGLAVRADVNRLGQQRADRAVLAVADQAFDDVQHHAVGGVVAVDAGVGRADVGRLRHSEHGGMDRHGGKRQGERKRPRNEMVVHGKDSPACGADFTHILAPK